MKKKKKKYFHTLAEKYAENGVTPPCPYADRCGGCMFQHLAYEDQLKLKHDYLTDLLGEITEIPPVNGAAPLGYRNRMDMVTAFGKAGLREEGQYKFVVDLEDCPLMQQGSRKVLHAARPFLLEADQHNYLNHQGYLRYLVMRESFFTGQVMANLVVAEKENRLDELLAVLEPITDSLNLLHNPGLADTSFGEIFETRGAPHIEEDFDGIRYRITPNSFFQSNSPVAREMYRRIRDNIEGDVLDLYSGVGSITLYIARASTRVTGVELVEEAVDAARENMKLNNITNAEFHVADAKEYLKEKSFHHDTLVMDPPRSGLHPKIRPWINDSGIPRIVYMSCNPATFRDDLAEFTNYRLVSFEAWDMFPQTPHVETLALLERL